MSTPQRLKTERLGMKLGRQAVLSDLSLAFEPGRVTVIIGPNGAGKSTLLSCLAGLMHPTEGAVRLGECDLKTLPNRERARRIGILPQSPEVAWAVDGEILVGLGRLPYRGAPGAAAGREDRAIVAAAMEQTATTPFANRVVTTLSGGERGRVLMARALAGQPDWLLADEPLTGLDPGHQFDVCDLLRRIADEGRGVIVTLHDLPLAARLADRLIILSGGRLVADGTPSEALTEARLAAVYGVRAEIVEVRGGLSITLLGR